MLGAVDGIAAEHGLDTRSQAKLIGQRHEAVHHAAIDPLARVVERQACGLDAAMLETLCVLIEQCARGGRFEAAGQRLEFAPDGTVGAGTQR